MTRRAIEAGVSGPRWANDPGRQHHWLAEPFGRVVASPRGLAGRLGLIAIVAGLAGGCAAIDDGLARLEREFRAEEPKQQVKLIKPTPDEAMAALARPAPPPDPTTADIELEIQGGELAVTRVMPSVRVAKVPPATPKAKPPERPGKAKELARSSIPLISEPPEVVNPPLKVEPVVQTEELPTTALPPRKGDEQYGDFRELIDSHLEQLVGLSEAKFASLMGSPTLQEEEPPARVWYYAARECTLKVFFYPDVKSGTYHALLYEVTLDEASSVAEWACIEQLAQAGPQF